MVGLKDISALFLCYRYVVIYTKYKKSGDNKTFASLINRDFRCNPYTNGARPVHRRMASVLHIITVEGVYVDKCGGCGLQLMVREIK